MPKKIPTPLIIEKNRTNSPNAWIAMLEFTLNDSASTVLRFARNNEPVTYEGHVFPAFNFDMDATEQNASGEMPTVTLRVGNITQYLVSYMRQFNGCVGSTVRVIVVNSGLLGTDTSEMDMTFDIMAAYQDALWVVFTLGAPNLLRQRFPLDKYLALHCRHSFETRECNYTRKTVAAVTLAGSQPVSIEVTGHNFDTGASIRHADLAGITPTLTDTHIITVVDANNYTLNGTVSSDYSGGYSSGGTAGYAICPRTLTDCGVRENSPRFGGHPGMRSGGVEIA